MAACAPRQAGRQAARACARCNKEPLFPKCRLEMLKPERRKNNNNAFGRMQRDVEEEEEEEVSSINQKRFSCGTHSKRRAIPHATIAAAAAFLAKRRLRAPLLSLSLSACRKKSRGPRQQTDFQLSPTGRQGPPASCFRGRLYLFVFHFPAGL
jgi:hypothetical protein